MKEKYLIVKCDNEECFYDNSKPLNCPNCDEGKMIYICRTCNKENEVKFSTWMRIDCDCGRMIIPCELNTYKLYNKK